MAINPGRNVGNLSIRVVPDTKKFREELKRRLDGIADRTSMTVRVDKAKVDNKAIREDISRQMTELKGVEAAVKVAVTVDRAKLKKTALRKSIQAEFDKFENVRVNIEAQIANQEGFQKEVRDMVDRANRNQVSISAGAFTSPASAQLAWVSRDRFVNLIVRVNQKSLTAAVTTLAALSGARLSWKWIDDLATAMKNLDKNLPAIVNWTTGITSLVGAIFGATSGLVGIGQGLFSILPAFLVLPGLLINALGSVTALVVALRNAGTELAPLKSSMSELGDIINEAFWGKARQPILNLVTGLMPQLRNSFRELSLGVGEFTGALADSFGKELANGRLESIFRGIADGWRVLATGADGFAGALVSLSQIAATYTPRLAGWFVRQANTFDSWLKAISEDGRLGAWMESAIDSMYDLWDATTGIAGVFEGLWRAADAAGSGGLDGFAKLMLTWEKTVKGADFQKGLTAIFRGSSVAMTAFGDAVRAIGRLVVDLDKSFETFIGSAGKFLGGLIEGVANALNTPSVAIGLDDLSAGLLKSLEGILPALPAIADTFGNFLGLLGDLAATLLPAAAEVLAELMPSIDAIISGVRDVLPELSSAVVDFANEVGPALADFVRDAVPILKEIVLTIADLLREIAPALASIIRGLADLILMVADILGIDPSTTASVKAYEASGLAPNIADYDSATEYFNDYVDGAKEYAEQNPIFFKTYLEGVEWSDDAIAKVSDEIRTTLASDGKDAAQAMWEEFSDEAPAWARDKLKHSLADIHKIRLDWSGSTMTSLWKDNFINEFESIGLEGAQAMWDSFTGADQDSDAMQSLLGELRAYGIDIQDVMGDAGSNAGEVLGSSIGDGVENSRPYVDGKVNDLKGGLMRSLEDLGTQGMGAGGGFSRGLAQGITGGLSSVTESANGLRNGVMNAMAGSGSKLYPEGTAMSQGFASGITAGGSSASGAAAAVRNAAAAAFRGASTWGIGFAMSQGIASGIADGGGLVSSAARNAVSRAVKAAKSEADIHSPSRVTMREIGVPLAQGVAVGIDSAADGIARSMSSAVDLSGVTGTSPTVGAAVGTTTSGVSLHIHNPVVKDLNREAWEAAQMAGAIV